MVPNVRGREIDRTVSFKCPRFSREVLNGKERDLSERTGLDINNNASYSPLVILASTKQDQQDGEKTYH